MTGSTLRALIDIVVRVTDCYVTGPTFANVFTRPRRNALFVPTTRFFVAFIDRQTTCPTVSTIAFDAVTLETTRSVHTNRVVLALRLNKLVYLTLIHVDTLSFSVEFVVRATATCKKH